eukprot:CAMPEP_0194211540 /NCGR_PEP_ID=MMETSP0156-20130528/10581_1 /TAXON_ID=33649 /ORGANISM="Thalassionema nitzschioides, Strain L26-B" /LENGTH=73 /DNA_ID=CAMNT_0038939125 /DNA_START=91 /DNA_END=312 /DNA_ORIENTATION=+
MTENQEPKRPSPTEDSESSPPPLQRSRTDHTWLAPPRGGQRHTRIGEDFQVASLPTPSPNIGREEKENDEKDV